MRAVAATDLYADLIPQSSTGIGEQAQGLREFLNEYFSEVLSPAGEYWRLDALGELAEICAEHSQANWDGYGAVPISDLAYREAKRFLLELPSWASKPELMPMPNGEVGFEWRKRKNMTFVLTVGSRQSLTFVGLFGTTSRIRGVDYFGETIPSAVLENLRKLLQ